MHQIKFCISLRNTRLLLLSCLFTLTPLASQAEDRLSLLGIGVADLQRSTEFYQAVLGMEVVRTYELGYINEVVLGFPASSTGDAQAPGAQLVLMNWPEQKRPYNGNDVKLVFDVDNPAAVLERIRERGGKIDLEAGPIDALPGAIVGLGRDPDNYVVEVIKR